MKRSRGPVDGTRRRRLVQAVREDATDYPNGGELPVMSCRHPFFAASALFRKRASSKVSFLPNRLQQMILFYVTNFKRKVRWESRADPCHIGRCHATLGPCLTV